MTVISSKVKGRRFLVSFSNGVTAAFHLLNYINQCTVLLYFLKLIG